MNEPTQAICVCECPDAQDMVIVSQGRLTVTFDIQKEIGLSSVSTPSLGASEALPPFSGTLTLPPVANLSLATLEGDSATTEGSSGEARATSTLPELVNQIKKTMGYSDDTELTAVLAKALIGLGIEEDGTAKSKANRIAEELGFESRC